MKIVLTPFCVVASSILVAKSREIFHCCASWAASTFLLSHIVLSIYSWASCLGPHSTVRQGVSHLLVVAYDVACMVNH